MAGKGKDPSPMVSYLDQEAERTSLQKLLYGDKPNGLKPVGSVTTDPPVRMPLKDRKKN